MAEDPKSEAKAEPAAAQQASVQRQVVERTVVREVTEPPPGPNATTDPEKPEEHYFLASDGETKVNAFGEDINSKEAKQRAAGRGF